MQQLDSYLMADVLRALENDAEYKFKTSHPKHFHGGHCTTCGRNSLFISKSSPYRIACSHASCAFNETVFNRYDYLFENIAERFPATVENPNASAIAYMGNSRGFPVDKISTWFSQGSRPLPSGRQAPTVRFMLWGNHYWERLINAADIREFAKKGEKRKAHFSREIKYSGKCWMPEGQTIEQGDFVYIVEGIFHAIALHLIGKKSVAAFSCTNLPRELIEANTGRGVTWLLGYDNDYHEAGNDAALKYRGELQRKNETVEIVLCPKGLDWDDVYKEGKLTDSFLDECLHRGRVFGAGTISERAYWLYLKHSFNYRIIDFKNRLYSVSVDNKLSQAISELIADASINPNDSNLKNKDLIDFLKTADGRKEFDRAVSDSSISNCLPEFIYSQVDKSNGEVGYHFNVKFPNSRPMQIVFTGSALESPGSFNKALLNQAPGATFDGSANQLKIIRDLWFDRGVMIVDTIPFIGYDKDSKTYVFPEFGFSRGQFLKLGRYNYIEQGNTRIKTTLTSIKINNNPSFNGDWINDYYTAFSYNGLAVLSFFLGSLFAEQIRAQLGFFPFLEFTGQAGAGKTTVIEFCWKLLGRSDYEGINPSKATFAARSRVFTQTSNMPLVLIEGDSRDGKDAKKGGFDFSELKDLFNGRGVRATGAFNRGNDIIEPPFRGSVLIAQNNTIDADEAVLTRIVHCHATTAHQKRENKPLAEKFQRMEVDEACGFLSHALRQETAIIESIVANYRTLDETYSTIPNVKHQRIVQCHALVGAFVKTLPLMFPTISPELIEQTINMLGTRAVARQQRIEQDHPTVAAFWEIYDLLNEKPTKTVGGYVEHGEKLNHAKDPGYIAINMQEFNQAIEYHRMERLDLKELRRLLPSSQKHKFLGNKAVKSQIFEGESRWCSIFKKAANLTDGR